MTFQVVAEKTANNFRRLLFFAAPGTWVLTNHLQDYSIATN